jgi:hypothetical protein
MYPGSKSLTLTLSTILINYITNSRKNKLYSCCDDSYTSIFLLSLSNRCFGPMKSSVTIGPSPNSNINSSVSHHFINQVCHSLKCVRGIVKGSIHTVPDGTSTFIYDLFRCIMLFVLVTVICVQGKLVGR